MDYQKAHQAVSSGKIDNIYLLYGEEVYLVDQLAELIRETVLADGARDFNCDRYIAGDVGGGQIKDVIETFPMMASRRLIQIKNFNKMKEKDLEILAPVLEKPVDTSVLILIAEKVDKRKKIFKTLKKTATIVECQRLYENQVQPWISYIAESYGLQMDRPAQLLMLQAVGSNLTEIDNEMRKIQQYLGDQTRVDAAIVEKVVSKTRAESVFELANAIGQNDRVQALTRLAHLLDQGQNEVGVLAMVSRHFRILADIQHGLQQGLKGAKLGQSAGVHPYFLQQYIDQSKAWSKVKIEKTHMALLETDKALKSSPISSHIWLENFILRTCG